MTPRSGVARTGGRRQFSAGHRGASERPLAHPPARSHHPARTPPPRARSPDMTTSHSQRGRFAFLIHPRTDPSEDLALVNPLLGLLPGRLVEGAMRRLPLKPWVHSTVMAADRPDEVLGDVIALPLTPSMLL